MYGGSFVLVGDRIGGEFERGFGVGEEVSCLDRGKLVVRVRGLEWLMGGVDGDM